MGLSSPDSDYDCRFVYVRPVIHHIGLVLHRDVIEFRSSMILTLKVGTCARRRGLAVASIDHELREAIHDLVMLKARLARWARECRRAYPLFSGRIN
ncbi:DNA polymerase beta superfamily protein [Rhizobium sp. BK650]|uniref:DNA polymerase beta superfamily protein n=1 Tax=Rhizobium sp. BK650 TaxID=2586990 RepID=UPI001FEE9120|nr:nucleotidyltransferase domain-containing protein [Rhizobium sp. BK650]